MMKAILKKEPGPGLIWGDVPVPEPAEGEVLIKTLKTAICGTDLHIEKWDAWTEKNVSPPLVIGHEFVGTVAKLGPGVREVEMGQRVIGEGHITCGKCRNCLEGKFHFCNEPIGLGVQRDGCCAEYFTLPAENLFYLPPEISDDVAAIFDPYGNAIHTALSYDLAGEDVLITGLGPIGLMAVMIAKFVGARTVAATDVNAYRLNLAKRLGATEVLNVDRQPLESILGALPLDGGFTVGLEMSGHPKALTSLLGAMRHGGEVALLGILPEETHIDWDDVIFKGLNLRGIYGRKVFETWFKGLHLIQSGLPLAEIITHQYPADSWEMGFNIMRSGESGKVLLNWT